MIISINIRIFQMSEELQKNEVSGRSDLVKLKSELEIVHSKLAESVNGLHAEREKAVSLQGQLLRSQSVVEELKDKLASATDMLSSSMRNGSNVDNLTAENEKYLQAINDVVIVIRTACDKYLTPASSAAGSRVNSMDDIGSGSEAVKALEANVKAVLRMIDNVYDKSRYLDKENQRLENKLYDVEVINHSLRDRLNRPVLQRLIEPIMVCRWPGRSQPDPASPGGLHGSPSPVHKRGVKDNREMSHLLNPSQNNMREDFDLR